MRIHCSPHALGSPKKPITDDMREMVETMERFGLIRMVPAAFQINGTLVVHPTIYEKLKQRAGFRIEPFDPFTHQGWERSNGFTN